MTQPMPQPTTHPFPTATSPVSPTVPAIPEAPHPTRARATRRGSRMQRITRITRITRWLAVGASAVALLRGLVELLAAWRAL